MGKNENILKMIDSAIKRIGDLRRDDADELIDKILARLGKIIGPERTSALRKRIPKKKKVPMESKPKGGKKQAAKNRTCSVRGCDNPHRSKGYCTKHYSQWRRGKLMD